MIKSIVPAAILSLIVMSAAWALPVPSSGALAPLSSSDLIQIKKGGGGAHHGGGGKHHGGGMHHGGGKHYAGKHYNGGKHYHGKNYHHNYNYHGNRNWRGYHYKGRYWGHRYVVRPYNWNVLGCIQVGPIWYCP